MIAQIIIVLSVLFALSVPYATDYQQFMNIEEQGSNSLYYHNLPYLLRAYTNHGTMPELRAKMNFLYNNEEHFWNESS